MSEDNDPWSSRGRRRGVLVAAARRGRRRRRSCSACNATAPARRRSSASTCAPAYHDYIDLVNSKGGVEGYKIKLIEIDNRVQGAAGDGSLSSSRRRRARSLMAVYGTPQTQALTKN